MVSRHRPQYQQDRCGVHQQSTKKKRQLSYVYKPETPKYGVFPKKKSGTQIALDKKRQKYGIVHLSKPEGPKYCTLRTN